MYNMIEWNLKHITKKDKVDVFEFKAQKKVK